MKAYLESFAGNPWLFALAVILTVVPVLWKLLKEAWTLKRSAHKDALADIYQVIGCDEVTAHPLQAELVFWRVFNCRLTVTEIRYFLRTDSPLSGFLDYRYGRRHIHFDPKEECLRLTKSERLLWIQAKIGAVIFSLFSVALMIALVFTFIAISIGSSWEEVSTGGVWILAASMCAWFSLDAFRAADAALRLVRCPPVAPKGERCSNNALEPTP